MESLSLPVVTVTIDREKIARMAVAINDPNPIHLEDTLARQAGFPGVIAHGTFAIGAIGLLLTQWAGQQHISHLETRLLAPVFPGDQLVCEGQVESVEGNRAMIRAQVLAGERRVAIGLATVVWPEEGLPPWLRTNSIQTGSTERMQ